MGCDTGHSKGMPKSSSVSSSDEKLGMLSSESKICASESKVGGDGNHILGQGSVGGLSKFISGLGVGKKGNGDRMERGGGVVFGEETEGEGISIHFEDSNQNLLVVWVLEKKAMVIKWKVLRVWYLVKKVQGKVERM